MGFRRSLVRIQSPRHCKPRCNSKLRRGFFMEKSACRAEPKEYQVHFVSPPVVDTLGVPTPSGRDIRPALGIRPFSLLEFAGLKAPRCPPLFSPSCVKLLWEGQGFHLDGLV